MTHPCVGAEQALRVFSPDLNCRLSKTGNRRSCQVGIDAPCVGTHPNAPVPLGENEFTDMGALGGNSQHLFRIGRGLKHPPLLR